ncbi:type II secretion system GspH family protein [Methylobacillus gramineus]|uniref:type II secretion system protein n=1 Tax=Methylobacillus gramineus TaxID=755169 RepID=UPI001CFFF7A4|nr:type II secretion system protein [Methylobacillus gramineus]MCB5183826.1 type II secretion system GspH family protein [Methylobacillus gramineus]
MAATMPNGRLTQRGFSLMGALLIIMLVGFSLAEAGNSWSNIRKREREQELLKVGDTLRKAIGNYYNQSPGMVKQFPPTLKSLLKDDRFPVPQRYLRQLYIDPTTGRPGWGLLYAPSGGIMGVYSLSSEQPFKTRNFPERYKNFEKKKAYIEWIFAYLPEADNSLTESLN